MITDLEFGMTPLSHALPMDDECNWVFNTRNGVDWLSAVGGRVNCWMRWGYRGAILRRNVALYVDMSFSRCTEKWTYASRLPFIVRNGSDFTDAAPTTQSSEYAAFSRSFDWNHL